mgnify:FL=1
MKDLTRKQLDVLMVIKAWWAINGSPSFNDIAGAMGITKSNLFHHVQRLRKKGYLVPATNMQYASLEVSK